MVLLSISCGRSTQHTAAAAATESPTPHLLALRPMLIIGPCKHCAAAAATLDTQNCGRAAEWCKLNYP